MAIKAPRGTHDILPDETPYFQFMERTAREVFARYGYEEIRTPIFESTDLFTRSIGEETDIVSKEMYTFEDRRGRSLTLRPEGTAPVVRAMVEHGLLKQQGAQVKVFYAGPMFRYERPQAGRQRQFHTVGVEYFGCPSALADAEAIAMLSDYLEALGFDKPQTRVNSIGNAASRQAYNEALRKRLAEVKDEICDDCRRRAEANPLRVLDCKAPRCGEIYADFPMLVDFLDDASRAHYEAVLEMLESLGVAFDKDPSLVRGFDYYTHTVFETSLPGLGAQDAALGGGRYDNLVEQLGGPPTPAVGAGFGLERLVLAMHEAGIVPPGASPGGGVYVAAFDEESFPHALLAAQALRRAGHAALFEFVARSPKAALRAANRCQAIHAVLIGAEERAQGLVKLKDMESGQERNLPVDRLADALARN